MGVGWESETQDLPLLRDCPLPTAGIWGETFQKSLALLSDGSLCGQRRELTDGLWIRAYDKVTEGGFVLKCLLLNISMKARHVPVACNQIADSPSLPFPASPARVTGTGGESSALPRLDALPAAMRSALGILGPEPPAGTPRAFRTSKSSCGSQAVCDRAGQRRSLLCSANVTAPLPSPAAPQLLLPPPGWTGGTGSQPEGTAPASPRGVCPAECGQCGMYPASSSRESCTSPFAPAVPQEGAGEPAAKASPKGHCGTSQRRV